MSGGFSFPSPLDGNVLRLIFCSRHLKNWTQSVPVRETQTYTAWDLACLAQVFLQLKEFWVIPLKQKPV